MHSAPSEDDALTRIPEDALAGAAPSEVQKRAAHMAQDAFAEVFRLTVGADDAGRAAGVERLRGALYNWVRAGEGDEARALRMAMLLAGLDQWGLAYSRAFGLQAIPGLTELVGGLRTALDPQADAQVQQQFAAIDAGEGNVIDFKIDLRRGLHLALWHAMIASEEREQATAILSQLGGMLFMLVKAMPCLGWRLVADTLAQIQIQCLSQGLAAEGLARETTFSLFAALTQELPEAQRDLVMAHAGRSVVAWREAQGSASGTLH